MEVTVNKERSGMRLDAFISLECESISRMKAQELIKSEKVLLDENKAKASNKVNEGQKVSIPDVIEEKANKNIVAEDISIDIIYEDDDIIVINKPKNMVVHPAVGNYTGTLVNAVLGKRELSNLSGDIRPGIVHRLDKNTTGVLVVAKNNNAHGKIAKQIQDRKTKKIYIALVRGLISENDGVIDMPIGRHPTDRKKMAVVKDGKNAITKFKVLERFEEGYTLLEIELKTGRTHQIRVHMSQIGHPVIGDNVYSSGKNIFEVKSQLLHSYKLGFAHPKNDEWVEYTAKLPEEFKEVLQKLNSKTVIK